MSNQLPKWFRSVIHIKRKSSEMKPRLDAVFGDPQYALNEGTEA